MECLYILLNQKKKDIKIKFVYSFKKKKKISKNRKKIESHKLFIEKKGNKSIKKQ